MANLADRATQYEFYKRHHHLRLREEAWAGLLSDLDRTQRQHLRESLQVPDASDDIEYERLRPRLLVALDSLDSIDLLEDPRPTRTVQSQAKALIARIAKG